ncbi:MAG: bestrophin family ion channel [Salibacteraceae bacterium]|nr:bestrophin family ion channel [Salibacteraceae bacterium]
MVDYDPHSWVKLIFNNDSKNIFKQLWPPMLTLLVYTTVVVFVFNHFFNFHYPGGTAIHSLLGVVLGLFLVFRTNTAYDRWWEGRKQWGALVNCSRNTAIKVNTCLPESHKDDKEFFAVMISNFVFAMKEHLREGVNMEEIQDLKTGDFKNELETKNHMPAYIVNCMYKRLNELRSSAIISAEQFWIIDQEMQEFLDILGACERIKNTPIPYSYNMYIKKFIFTYSVTLPFGIMSITHYWTIPITCILFYLLVSTELIAEEIEDPFGMDDNDLPTDSLSGKIKRNVEEILLSN